MHSENDVDMVQVSNKEAISVIGAIVALPIVAFFIFMALTGMARASEPFEHSTITVSTGTIRQKWLGVKEKFDADMIQLIRCDKERSGCTPAALRLLTIVDDIRKYDGRAMLDEANRDINRAIRAQSDGPIDIWSSPLETFQSGTGDCEDYAIAKLAALQLAGMSDADLRLVVVRSRISGEGHAIAVARFDGHWIILDNRRMELMEDVDAKFYQPFYTINETNVSRYLD